MKRTLILAVALLPAIHLAWTARDVPQLGFFGDDAIYLMAAKSLAESGSYRMLSLPSEPAQTKYPPLYPLLLSLAWRVNPQFPDNLPAALALSWLWLPALLPLSWLVFERFGASARLRLALCCALALNPVLAYLSINLMTELMFSCLLLSCLLVAERALSGGRSQAGALLSGVLGGLAYLTRSAALPLVVSAPLLFLWRRKAKAAVWFLVGILPAVLAWNVWAVTHKTHTSDLTLLYHTDYLGYHLRVVSLENLPVILRTNLDGFLVGIGRLILFSRDDGFWSRFVARILGILAIAGAARLARQAGFTQFHAFALPYSAMLVSWHYVPHERFTAPLAPLFLAGIVEEGRHVFRLASTAKTSGDRGRRPAAALVILSACVLLGWGAFAIYRAYVHYLPGFLEMRRAHLSAVRRALEWIAAKAEPGANFVAYQEGLLYLYGGKKACQLVIPVNLFYERNRGGILDEFRRIDQFAKERGLGYVFWTPRDYDTSLDEADRAAVQHILDHHPGLNAVYRSPGAIVYRVTASPDWGR